VKQGSNTQTGTHFHQGERVIVLGSTTR